MTEILPQARAWNCRFYEVCLNKACYNGNKMIRPCDRVEIMPTWKVISNDDPFSYLIFLVWLFRNRKGQEPKFYIESDDAELPEHTLNLPRQQASITLETLTPVSELELQVVF